MKKAIVIVVCCLSFMIVPLYASEGKLPVINGKITVATVNDEPITLDELNNAIAASHAERSGKEEGGRIEYSHIMKRLINTRLILLEARNIGLPQLSEIKEAIKDYSEEVLIKLLLKEHVKDITVDEEEVNDIYKVEVREWKIKSVIFANEEDAEKIAKKIKAENNFDKIVVGAIKEGIAKGKDEGYIRNRDLKPSIGKLVSNMEIGSMSPVVHLGKSEFMIFKVVDKRLPEDRDPEAWERARTQALNQKKGRAAKDYSDELMDQYAKIDEGLLGSLDYESGEGAFEKFLNDKRVIADIKGGYPVTVAEFSKVLKEKFYHGMQLAITSKRVNIRKMKVMKEILQKRVLVKEARKQGLDNTEDYFKKIRDYENSLIFATFVHKVIAPDIKLNINDITSYYEKNIDEYSQPEMMRIKSIVFLKRIDAVNALDKLIKGTDFNWLAANAESQASKNSKDILQFEGRLLVAKSLPEKVLKVVSGARPGDFRLYESPEGYYYALYIYDVIAAKPQPFDNVKEEIAEKVYKDKIRKSLEDYAEKLREYYPVKIYAKDLQ